MPYPANSLTPRNTDVPAKVTGTTTALTITFAVTATVAGDTGVVAIASAYQGSISTRTWTPPAGWVQVTDSYATSGLGVTTFINPRMAAGVTSLAFTLTVTGSAPVVEELDGIYACWQGSAAPTQGLSPPLGSTGGAVVNPTSGASPLPGVTSSAPNAAGVLWIWVGQGGFGASDPGTPTGTGTWTSIAQGPVPNSGQRIRMCAQLGSASGTATASGATESSGTVYRGASIFGINSAGSVLPLLEV